MPANVRRFLLCNDKCVRESDLHLHPMCHILGELIHVELEGRRVTALARWDVHVSVKEQLPTEPFILSEDYGLVRKIRCKAKDCNHHAGWEIGKAAFAALELRYRKVEVA